MVDGLQTLGRIQTVLGAIAPDDLGVTLPHEHLLIDTSVWFREPEDEQERLLAHQPVSAENMGWVRYHPMSSLDNARLMDERVAVEEATRYRDAGGDSIVELTPIGVGRHPEALVRIARETGLNIIMGSSYYVEPAIPEGLDADLMTERIVADIREGVADTGIQAGIIGEVGVQSPIGRKERLSLQAAARAQRETGAAINVHPARCADSPFECLEILDREGARLDRVIMSHIDSTIPDHETRVKLARTGCYVEYDLFSFEGWSPLYPDLPNDSERVNQLMMLIDEGFLHQLLISHDHCRKFRLYRYGGPGYAHILMNVRPMAFAKGMTREQMNAIMVENPKTALVINR